MPKPNKTSRSLSVASKTLGMLRLVLFLTALTGVFLYTRAGTPAHVEAAVPNTLNFQARLLTGAGSIVPDGTYNAEFKLYNVDTGGSALWTETRLTTDAANLRVNVRSGYLSVVLGDKTAFGAINWDQQLWLTMNIGGTSGTPSWDGEMTPRLRLTSVPYAQQAAKANQLAQSAGANSGTLSFGALTTNPVIALPDASGTVCLQGASACGFASSSGSGNYINNTTTLQSNSNFAIQSAGDSSITGVIRARASQTADLLQFQNSAGTNPLSGINSAGNLYYRDGASGFVATLGLAGLSADRSILLPNAGGTICTTSGNCVGNGGAGDIFNGGQAGPITIGTNDNTTFNLETNNTPVITLLGSGNVGVGIAGPTATLHVSAAGGGTDLFKVTDTTATAQDVLRVADGGATTLRNQTNSTAAFQVQSAASGVDVLTVDTTNSLAVLRGINSAATLGSDIVTSNAFNNATYWTCSSGWTPTGTNATHNTGNFTPCTATNSNFTVTAGATYEITFTIAGNTTTSNLVYPYIGNSSPDAPVGTNQVHQVVLRASNTTSLEFYPDSGFNGTISNVQIRLLTISNPVLQVKNASNVVALEVRASSITSNTFIGLEAGRANITGGHNVALGSQALMSNTTGSRNIAIGSQALTVNTTGSYNIALGDALFRNTDGYNNVAIGNLGLYNNATGSENVAIGSSSLEYNLTGSYNSAFGTYSLFSNTTGTNNTGTGYFTLGSNTTGTNNTALGFQAGYTSVIANANTTGSNNTFIGYNSGPGVVSATSLQNATSLGSYSVVNQNDALVLGCTTGYNGCTTSTNVGIGTANPTNLLSIAPLQYNTGTASQSTTTITGSGTTFTAAMVGSELVFANGTKATITGFTNATTLTATPSQTVSSQAYRIHYPGLQVNSSGRVGIGTVTPTAKLQVVGGGFVDPTFLVDTDAAGGGIIRLGNDSTNGDYVYIGTNGVLASDAGRFGVGTNAAIPITFDIFGSEKVRINSAGNLGIGTNNPTQLLTLGAGADRQIIVETSTTNVAGNSLTIKGGDAGAGASPFSGGQLILQGGAAAGTGNASGADVIIQGGNGVGTGVPGVVKIDTPVFTASATQTFAVSGTITQSVIDGNSTVPINATAASLTITLPAPGNTTVGRIIYITAVSGSNSFTLAPSGGVSFVMAANSTATFVWNGAAWTNAGVDGGSSSYIQNQNATDQTGNFRISGTGQINTRLITPIVQTADGSGSAALTVQSGNTSSGNNVDSGVLTLKTGDATTGNNRGSGNIVLQSGSAQGNRNSGSITIDSGTIQAGQGASTGAISIGTTNSTAITVGNSSATVTLHAGAGNINLNASQAQFSEITGTRTITVQTRTTNVAGSALTISGGTAGAGASAFSGGLLTLQGGNAGGTGNANGANVLLRGGTGIGTGVPGIVEIDTPVFTASSTQSFGSNGTITQSIVDGNSTIPVNATAGSLTITLPAPTNTTVGRIIYITSVTGSNTFTIAPSGGTNFVMNPNMTGTFVWNGTNWTNAGVDGGSASYIQNQNSVDQVANFRINGTGTLATIYGGTAASSTLTLAGTSNGSPSNAHIILNGTGQGNVGIGQPNPTSVLHTVATGAKTANYTGNLLTNTATSSTASINKYGLEVQSTGTWNGTSANNVGLYVSSVTGGTNNYDAIFNGGGNVGIGTAAPNDKLEVVGNQRLQGSLIFNPGGSVWPTLSRNATGGLILDTTGGGVSGANSLLSVRTNGGTDVMTVLAGGNVGVGDATPAALFTVGNGDLFQVSGSDFRLVENGATPSLYGIFDVGDLTGSNQTFTFTQGGLVCTDSGNCNGAGSSLQTSYNNSTGGTTPEIKLDSTRNALDIQDANTTLGATTNLLTVRASDAGTLGSLLFGVQANGDVTNSGNGIIQGSSLTIGTSNATTGSIVLKNSGNSNLLTLQSGATGGSGLTLTLPTADGASTDCLKTNGAGVLSFAACLGGGGGGVSSVNTLQGALTLAGTTNQINVANGGTTITLSTPQDINNTSSPKFASLTTGSAPTTLTTITDNPLTSGATTINVASTTSYPSASANAPATLLIESEIVTYTGTTATSFTGVVRGAYGTTAASHSSGVTVNNYLLNVATGSAVNPKFVVTGGGNVGIGTTSPGSVLHTVATGAKTGNYTGNLLTNTATSSTASVNKYGLEIQSTGTWNGTSANNIGLYVSSVTGGTNNYDAIFNGGGNVGIGTSSPQYKLHVNTGTSGRLVLGANDNTAGYSELGFRDETSGNLKWGWVHESDSSSTGALQNSMYLYQYRDKTEAATNAARMIINDSGLVGIGTPTLTVDARLHVGTNGTGVIGQIIQGVSGQTADMLQLKNLSTTVVNVTAGGSMGIGVANTGTAKLLVQGDAGISSGATTMTATSGATTFTTSASITLNQGDVIVPTTNSNRYVSIATTATGTSFTVSQPFGANITTETFTIYRSALRVNSSAGGLHVQGYNGRVGVGAAALNPVSEFSNSETNYTDTAGTGVGQFGLLWDSRTSTLSGYTAVLRNSSNSSTANGLLISTRQSSTVNYPLSIETGLAGSTTSRFVVRGDGNVGVGTASPGAKMDISNAASANTTTGFQLQSTFAPTAGGTQTNANLVVTNAPTTAANTAVGASLAVNDSTALANTLQGINLTLSDTGSAAKTVRGLFVDTSGTTNASATVTAALFKGTTTTNLVVQNGSSSELLRADTTNMVLKIGTTGAPTFGATTRLFTTVAEASTTLRIGTSTDGQEFSAAAPPVYRGTGRPTRNVTLVPEYAGATMTGTGSGTMTSDFCSNSLSVNASVCESGQEHNYYAWTSGSGTAQTYDIYVRHKLPSDFDGFASPTDAIKMAARRSASTSSVQISLYRNGTQCGSSITVNSSDNAWQENTGAINASGCNFVANDVATFRVRVSSNSSSFAYAGAIRFDYYSKF